METKKYRKKPHILYKYLYTYYSITTMMTTLSRPIVQARRAKRYGRYMFMFLFLLLLLLRWIPEYTLLPYCQAIAR